MRQVENQTLIPEIIVVLSIQQACRNPKIIPAQCCIKYMCLIVLVGPAAGYAALGAQDGRQALGQRLCRGLRVAARGGGHFVAWNLKVNINSSCL